MLSDTDRAAIISVSRQYHARRVVLFGSTLSSQREAHDIDLGVEGVPDRQFFAFYGDLMCALSKPVDVVDLSERSLFTDLVEREGVVVYG
jgi:predicted nucleotidyltransferase